MCARPLEVENVFTRCCEIASHALGHNIDGHQAGPRAGGGGGANRCLVRRLCGCGCGLGRGGELWVFKEEMIDVN